MQYIRIGSVSLPELPPGWRVAYDTETNGLYPDGDPGGDTGDPGSPPARVSVASIAFRDPTDPSRVVKHAWGFDQGPHPDKWGRVKRPREGGGVVALDVDKLLATLAKHGFGTGERELLDRKGVPNGKFATIPYTQAEAYRAEGTAVWVQLQKWLSRRDQLVMHNRKFDQHTTREGLRPEVIFRDLDDPEVWEALGGGDRPAARDTVPVHLSLGYDIDKGRPVRGIWDTMLVQAFFDPAHPVALKKTANRRLRVGSDESQQTLLRAMGKQGVGLTKRYDLTPWPIMEPYAADDAEMTLLLEEDQQERIREGHHPPNLWEQIDKEFELARVLYQMERRGLEYNVPESRIGAAILTAEMSRIADKLPYDPSKLAEVKQFYFGTKAEGGLGLIPLKLTEKTGQPALDEAQVRIFVQGGVAWAAEYDEWSHCRSAVGKWYRGWADKTGPDGRLRTVFKQCVVEEERAGARTGGTISGRLAVGRAQLQAIPHDSQLPELVRDRPVRGLIHAKPGYALWEMDLPQGEVRIATVIVGCDAMWDVVDSGRDLHGENAKRIFGTDEDDPRFEELRGVAKRIVFGTLYGAGVKTLQQQILEFTGIVYSLAETQAAKQAFMQQFPEFASVPRRIQRKADRNLGGPGYVTLIDGRRRWFGPQEKSHKAFNAVIQGDLAQTGKTWMIETERQVPGVQVLAIHDSIVVEVPDNAEGEQMAYQVARIGKQVYEKDYTVPARGNRVMKFDIKPKLWSRNISTASSAGRVESLSA